MEQVQCGYNSTIWNDTSHCNNITNHGRGNTTQRVYGMCGQCEGRCVYSVIEMFFVIGLLANLVVLFIIARDKRLRHPTFIGIATLALADFMFLTVNLIISFETVITSMLCIKPLILSRPFYITLSVCWFSANAHVALLAIIRYVTLSNPLRACALLRPVRVVLLSLSVWILGLMLLGILTLLITYGLITPGVSKEFIIVWWIIVYFFPVLITVVLHILKLCLIKNANIPSNSSKSSHQKIVQRMSTLVVMVILMATVLPLPKLVYNCLRVVGVIPSAEFRTHLRGVSRLVFLVNHFINPFMYGLLSRKFRRSLKEICFCVKMASVEDSNTDQSSVSVQKQSVSMETKQHDALTSTDDKIKAESRNRTSEKNRPSTTPC